MRSISQGSDDSGLDRKARMSPKKTPLSDLDIQIAHSPPQGAPAAEPTKAQQFDALRRNRYGKSISNTVDTWARQTIHVKDGEFKPLIFGGTYPIEVPTSPRASPPTSPLAEPSGKIIALADVTATVDPVAHKRELKKTIERSLDRFEAILAKREMGRDERRKAFAKRAGNTFDIDAPVELAGGSRAAPRQRDARYYVSGPKTFNIDEPVTFI